MKQPHTSAEERIAHLEAVIESRERDLATLAAVLHFSASRATLTGPLGRFFGLRDGWGEILPADPFLSCSQPCIANFLQTLEACEGMSESEIAECSKEAWNVAGRCIQRCLDAT